MLTCLMFGMMMYFNDERPPNNFVDAIFMAARAELFFFRHSFLTPLDPRLRARRSRPCRARG